MKALHSSHGDCKLACGKPWILGNQAVMKYNI